AASSSVGNTTPRTSSASYSSLASLSSSGDFEIGTSHWRPPLTSLAAVRVRRAATPLPRTREGDELEALHPITSRRPGGRGGRGRRRRARGYTSPIWGRHRHESENANKDSKTWQAA